MTLEKESEPPSSNQKIFSDPLYIVARNKVKYLQIQKSPITNNSPWHKRLSNYLSNLRNKQE